MVTLSSLWKVADYNGWYSVFKDAELELRAKLFD